MRLARNTLLLFEADERLRGLRRALAADPGDPGLRASLSQEMERTGSPEHEALRVRFEPELRDYAKNLRRHQRANSAMMLRRTRLMGLTTNADPDMSTQQRARIRREADKQQRNFARFDKTYERNQQAGGALHKAVTDYLRQRHPQLDDDQIQRRKHQIIARTLTRDLFPRGESGDREHRRALGHLHDIHQLPDESTPDQEVYTSDHVEGEDTGDAAGFRETLGHHGYEHEHASAPQGYSTRHTLTPPRRAPN